jgi:hypothetical protein
VRRILNDHFKIYTTTTVLQGVISLDNGKTDIIYILNAIEYVIDHRDIQTLHYYNDNDNLFFG